MPILTHCLKSGELIVGPLPENLQDYLDDPEARVWVDAVGLSQPEIEDLGRLFRFHVLAVEDCWHSIQRPKVDEYPGYLFFSFHAVDESGEGEVGTREIDGFLGANYLVTVHDEPSPEVQELMARSDRNTNLLGRGVDHLFHELLDRMVDSHFPILDAIERRIEAAEEDVFSSSDPQVVERLFQIKKELLTLRRVVGPQRDLLSMLSTREYETISQPVRFYLRDVLDHLLRLTDLLETYRDLVTGTVDAQRSEVSYRLNEVMKRLTVIGTISLPLTLIAGLWGMNVMNLPWAGHPGGFWFVVGLCVLVTLVLLALFRRARWL